MAVRLSALYAPVSEAFSSQVSRILDDGQRQKIPVILKQNSHHQFIILNFKSISSFKMVRSIFTLLLKTWVDGLSNSLMFWIQTFKMVPELYFGRMFCVCAFLTSFFQDILRCFPS
jgi:hypothetical protein